MIIYSRTAISQDTNGNLKKLTVTGVEQDSIKTFDLNSHEYLEKIFEQMKIINFQLGTITENFIDEIGE